MKTWMKFVALTLLCCLCAVAVVADEPAAVVAEDSSVAIEENSADFDLAFEAPEGAIVESNTIEGTTILDITLADQPGLKFVLTVAPDDRYAGRNLADFNEEELKALFASLLGDIDEAQAAFTLRDLHEGNKAMVLEFKELPEVANSLTIQDGYYIQAFGMSDDFMLPVTQENIDMTFNLLNMVHVMSAEAPAK